MVWFWLWVNVSVKKTEVTLNNAAAILNIISQHYEPLELALGSQRNADLHDSGKARSS